MSKNKRYKDNAKNRKQGRFSPSRTNICSGCKEDLGGNISNAKIMTHRCKE